MGQETNRKTFSQADEQEFATRLFNETKKLHTWVKEGRFAKGHIHIGQEVEFCLTDHTFLPAAVNNKFLKLLDDPNATTELATFNVEFNPNKVALKPGAILHMRQDFSEFMQRAFNVAEDLSIHLVMMGILPTISPGDLGSKMITKNKRYQAFLHKFAKWQQKKFCSISIQENDGLKLGLSTILMEAVTTSQQLHMQVPEPGSGSFYNAAQLLSAPMVAATANSPFFLGRNLWAETRIPLFEQILMPRFKAAGLIEDRENDFFGFKYVEDSVLELFDDNAKYFALALPDLMDKKGFNHLSLHNGTIWRWNRPVFHLDENNVPTLRLEHRVIPSSTSSVDMCANIALFIGGIFALVENYTAGKTGSQLEKLLPAMKVRENFYNCAKDGLQANVHWFGNKQIPVDELLVTKLIPLARKELRKRKFMKAELEFLEIMQQRVKSGLTGTQWQRNHITKHGGPDSANIRKLTGHYWRHQIQGMPVHRWSI